jgi:uncharacterized protein YceH (UPF0502 family)
MITAEGGRVLGCLVEKQLTTPQQYPLTRNALTLACSQATNREPVMALDEETVQRALQELKELHLVRFVLPSHGKSVTRYRHVLDEAHGLDTARVALLAVLLLRGPQTVGELRTRTGRMVEFDSLGAVQADLEVLAAQPEPQVRHHPRQPGQKEDRWQQLVATEAGTPGPPSGWVRPDPDRGAGWRREDRDAGTGPDPVPPSPAPADDRTALATRVDDLESEVMTLRIELEELTASLASLRQSLGE